jgi:RecA/RadA recombinase
MQFIHSGSSMLNLVLTGSIDGGWPIGRVSNIIGDSGSGKTLLAIEAVSMFLLNPLPGIKPFAHYYEAEAAFDQSYAEKLGMPIEQVRFIDVEDKTVEHLFSVIEEICDKTIASKHANEVAHLFVLDSLDAITSESELKQAFDDSATYAMGKQKKLGELFKKLVTKMEAANMHLMIISQVRENITAMPFAPKFRRSGGKALQFYCSNVLWLAEIEKLKTTTKIVYGVICKMRITKSRTGKNYRECEVPIIYSFGLDEIFSLLRFLSSDDVPPEFRIKKKSGVYTWRGISEKINELVSIIESEGTLYSDLLQQAQQAWDAIEEEAEVNRMNKVELILQHTKNINKPKTEKVAFIRRKVIQADETTQTEEATNK